MDCSKDDGKDVINSIQASNKSTN